MSTVDLSAKAFFIKVLRPNAKRWEFVRPDGRTTHLRIHASVVYDRVKADERRLEIEVYNPGVKAKLVEWK